MATILRPFTVIGLLAVLAGQANTAQAGPLMDAFNEVLTNEPSLARIETNLDRQIARRDIAQSAFKPQINLRLNENRIEQDTLGRTSEFDGQNYQLTASQSLYNAEAANLVDREEALIQESSHRLQNAQEVMALTLTERYFAVLNAKSRRQVLTTLVDNLRSRLLHADALVRAGQMSQLERVRIESRLAERRSELSNIERQIRETEAALNQLSNGLDPTPTAARQNTQPKWPDLRANEALQAHAIQNNSELLALQQRVEAETRGLQAVDSRRRPMLSFELGYADSNIGSNNRQVSDTQTTIYGVTLSLPIYRGGLVSSQRDEQTALIRSAEFDYETAVRELRRRIQTSIATFETAKIGFDIENERVRAHQRAVTVLADALDQGAVSQSEYLDALDSLANAQITRDDLLFAGLNGWLAAKIDSGTFSIDDLDRIDSVLAAFID